MAFARFLSVSALPPLGSARHSFFQPGISKLPQGLNESAATLGAEIAAADAKASSRANEVFMAHQRAKRGGHELPLVAE